MAQVHALVQRLRRAHGALRGETALARGLLLLALEVADVAGIGKIRASLVDAANATCFINAADLGLTGIEMPDALDASTELLEKLSRIRIAASIAMGIGKDAAAAAHNRTVPFISFVSPPQEAQSLSGATIRADGVDLTGRAISNGQPHRALPLTVTLCMAVAARIEGSIVNQVACSNSNPDAGIKIAMPSGVLVVAASVKKVNGAWQAEQGGFYRTQRRLFDGYVYVRASRVPGLVAGSKSKVKAVA